MLADDAISGMFHCINIHFICIIIHKPDVKVYRWPRHCIIGNMLMPVPPPRADA